MAEERKERDVASGLHQLADWLSNSTSRDTPISFDFGDESRTTDHPSAGIARAPQRAPVPDRFGRYCVVQFIADGGFAAVYEGWDEQLQRRVAIKVPLIEEGNDAVTKARFLDEAQKAAKLDHPNIVKVYDCGQASGGEFYIVSEFVDGVSLDQRLKERSYSWPEATALVAKVAAALHEVHRCGLVHRDVKPANILIDDQGEPRLTDFGLALADDEVHLQPVLAGTYRYFSPEQAGLRGAAVDGRSDIFSLGVVYYLLLTGKLPFAGKDSQELLTQIRELPTKPVRQYNDQIPERIERLCLHCLEKDPSHRFSTAADLAQELRAALNAGTFSKLLWRTAVILAIVVAAAVALVVSQPWRQDSGVGLSRFEVLHYDRSNSEIHNAGPIDAKNASAVHLGDSIRVDATFNHPLYASLYTLDADGTVTQRFPLPDHPNNRISRLVFPSGDADVYTLNDGAGVQSVLLVAGEDSHQLPPDFVQTLQRQWARATATAIWSFDGTRFELIGGGASRGQVESLAQLPEPFRKVCAIAGDTGKSQLVRAIAFPILPRVADSDSHQ